MNIEYKCLHCGSTHGEPAEKGTENFYWRMVPNGRIGPFCSESCSRVFRMADLEPLFTLAEAMRLLEVSHRTNNVAS